MMRSGNRWPHGYEAIQRKMSRKVARHDSQSSIANDAGLFNATVALFSQSKWRAGTLCNLASRYKNK
jgi:hypothetical protein